MTKFSTLPPIKEVIARHEIFARKSLGQHFLTDGTVTATIARQAGDLKQANVIEIGPGPGGLTRALLEAEAKRLFVIEKDARCIAALEPLREAAGDRLKIIEGDALDVYLPDVIPAPRKIVANLPYNAGTRMLLNWLEDLYRDAHAYASLTLMFQKEVGERICAPPDCKDYGRLSVLSQWLCECSLGLELPPSLFSPPPKVDSVVVTLIPRARPLVDVDKESLELVVGKAFGQRRKMLRSALKGLPVPADIVLKEAGIDGSLRAEVLDVPTLCRLAQAYQRMSV